MTISVNVVYVGQEFSLLGPQASRASISAPARIIFPVLRRPIGLLARETAVGVALYAGHPFYPEEEFVLVSVTKCEVTPGP
jgi:hypothetical protein